ncbi:MAG: methyltransferase domain-containing protein [Deltaproteobacteria bacterium]|nr:methyltransferase domain-containing protein [Deltaproteobacteria bacterium]
MPSGKSYVEWNEEMVRRYDPGAYHERSSVLIRALERQRTRRIVRLLGATPNHRILEVGVGAGNVLERVPGARRVGIDLSSRVLGAARRRLGETATLVRGDAAVLPFGRATFDRVICSEVLEHLPDPGAAVAEIARVVKPDGVVVLSVPNEALIDRLKRIMGRTHLLPLLSTAGYHVPHSMKDEWHLHEFDLALLRRVAEPHLMIDRTSGVPHSSFPIRWVARCLPLAR